MIEVHNLHKTFGKVTALQGVTFSAQNSKITGLLGPNGAGKTTTLRILYTLVNPTQGEARIDGFDTCRQKLQAQRCLGALPDSQGLYQRLTARENIRYYGQLHGMNSASLEQRIDELVQMLDMGDFEHRRTEGFSSGQRVKVAIARAIIHNPTNILFDEPTNGLDVMSTRAMRTFIRRLRDAGHCVLFSSHIMQEVAALCDHIVIINQGQVAAQGSAAELLALTGQTNLEDAFVSVIGTEEGLLA